MIIRDKNRETFTVISNKAINDTQISDKALGTLVRLLSKTDNWNLSVNYMVKTGKQGRTAVRSSIAELEKAGYIHRQMVRNEAGRITGTESLIYEDSMAGKQGVTTTEMSSNVRQPLIQEESKTSQAKTSPGDEVHSQETCPTGNEPVINTNIEQTLRETTTTTPEPEPETNQKPAPEVEVIEKPSPSSYPATEDINFFLDLIPEQHQQPMVKTLVNQAMQKYTALEVQEAITYASANVKGGWMQYKAYLDKTLKNQWAAGCLETISTTSPALSTPGTLAGGIPAGRYPNGTVTGSARMDSNYMAAAKFLARRRATHDK